MLVQHGPKRIVIETGSIKEPGWREGCSISTSRVIKPGRRRRLFRKPSAKPNPLIMKIHECFGEGTTKGRVHPWPLSDTIFIQKPRALDWDEVIPNLVRLILDHFGWEESDTEIIWDRD